MCTYTSPIYRWYSETRNLLFYGVSYVKSNQNCQLRFLKIGSHIENSIFEKYTSNHIIGQYISQTPNRNRIYYRTAGGGYWTIFLNADFDCVAVSNKSMPIVADVNEKLLSAGLNSNLFWWYYAINYDLFNFKDYMIFGFQLSARDMSSSIKEKLILCSNNLECSLRENAFFYVINSKTRGANKTVTYNKKLSKPQMDEIDKVLAKHYGFTEEELDFIINYDIKYRMGDELNEE